LGRVVIAEDMDSALAAARKLQGWSRIVTLQGELVTPDGALTGGSLQGRGAHLVGRKGEIDDLNGALPGYRSEVETLTSEIAQISGSLGEVEKRLADTVFQAAELQARLATTQSEAASAEREQARLESVRKDLDAEAAELGSRSKELQAEVLRWEAFVSQSESEDAGVDETITAAAVEARRLEGLREKSRTKAVSLEVELGRILEQRSALEKSGDANRRMLRDLELTRESKQTQREIAGGRLAEAGGLERELHLKLAAAKEHLERCEAQLDQFVQRVQTLRSDSFEKAAAIKETTKHRGNVLQEMHDAELQIARLEVRLAQAVQRLNDEYAISREDALERPEPEDMDRATVNEVSRLRREIRSMGIVNTGAVEEYERLTERHDFLAEQRTDLDKAKESLLATIDEIDESTRDIFMETFEAVSIEFSRLFHRLFGGGSTRLILTTPDDLLETGIEVIAQPPGKKAQHLSLLSGGERALTAVALLFSFLAVRPSPFCLLDEVDAPLDGPNVEKFVELVKEFSEKTQFLVITHNPTTMESAPRWYGVTMQEPGISRILSYRVPDAAIVSEPEEAIMDTHELVSV
jgi:chromosome segregation protein